MRRYFIACGDAATLILESSRLAGGGELFVTVMGEPVGIRDLAEQMIRLAGKEPGRDVAISFRGARPGEKIDEERFFDESVSGPTVHPRLRLAHDGVPGGAWLEEVDALVQAAHEEEAEDRLRQRLRLLVPEYRTWTSAGKEPTRR
jgi:FlaA1/EpsC-like NDP-sugar epimerase